MINKKRVVVSVLCLMLLVFGVFSFSACKSDEHTHTYESAWSYDAENHWHKATCEHTTEISGKASHSFADDSCSICGYHKGTEIPDNPSDKYTVVFDSNNGRFSNTYSLELTVNTGSLLTVPEEPIRDGYVFVGWAKNSEGTQLWDFSNDKVVNNITLYAVWLQEFTITFDANGGKFSDNKNTYELASYYGAKISMVETPERSGYTFIGWYTNSSLADLWDFENNTISSAITLYAGWKADVQEHNINFVLNYSGAENVIRSTENGLVTYIPTRAGYVFNGWWYSDGQTDEGFILSRKFDTTEIVAEDGLTLYAEWVEEATVSSQLVAPSVSINQRTFNWVAVSGATGYNIKVYKSGSSEELTNETITGTSWTFPSGYEAGYYNVRIRANGDGINTVNSSYVSKSYAHNILGTISDISFDISTSILTWTVVKDATEYELYINNQLVETLTYTTYDLSNYEAGTYTVKIVSKRNGYQSSTTTKSIEKKRLKTPNEVRTFVNSESKGYTITWDAVAHADTYILMIGDREIRLTDTFYAISSSATYWVEQSLTFTIQAFDSSADYLISIATDEVTLGKIYSLTTEANIENVGEIGVNGNVYIPQEYVVSFNLNGGSGSVASQTITSSDGLKYPSIPTRSNYVFRGWYCDSACTQLYDFTAAVTKNITLYAGWHSITTSGYSTSIIDITSSYRTSSDVYSASNRYATSSSNANYVYFRALTSGSYTFYYKNAKSTSSSYGTYFYVYNVTKGTVAVSNRNTYSTSYSSVSFTADAGDVFYVRAYKYSSSTSYYSNYHFYITGATLPTAGGKVVGGDYMEAPQSSLSSVLVSYGAELSITATTKDDRYVFVGWYNGETLLTEERTYIFTMPAEDINYTAKWIYYSVTTKKNIDEAGSITSHSDSPVKAGEKVTLTASTNNGYTWLGWYDGDTLLTNELTYTFTMAEQSVEYTAKWMVCPVTLEKSINEAGSVMGVSGATKAGEETTVTATTNDGYTWLGWYNGDVELTKELSYTFNMPTEAVTLTAKWTYFTVTTNTNEINGGTYTTLNAEKNTAGNEVTIVASTNSGYMWMGWYNGETLVSLNPSYTFTMSTENVVYTAKWTACPVILEKNIEEAGSVGGMGNTTVVGEEITVVATTNEGYTFLGWYNGDAKLTEELSYTFNMSTETVTYTAKWTFYTFTTKVDDSDAGNITSYTGEKITAGSSVTISASTKSGYTFLGWYNGDELITNTSSYTFEMPKENVVYTARWTSYTLTVNKTEGGTVNTKPSSVIVSFDLNGASGESPVSQIITETNGLTYPDIPTRSNYVFAGWYENADCSGAPFDFSAPICNNTTLYAKWIAYTGAGVISINDHFTVSVVSKNNTNNYKYYAFVPLVSGSITIYTTGSLDTYGYLYNSSKSQLTHNDDDGEGNNFSITYSVTAGTLYYIVPCGYSSSGNTTLYLTGNAPTAGGIVSDEALGEFSEPVKVTAGENVTLYAGTNSGYTFLGWYNGDSRVSTDLEYTFEMPAENITYTAKWTYYTLTTNTTDSDAGTFTEKADEKVTVGENITLTASTKDGYTWLGWYNGNELLTSELNYTFEMPAENITYTAKWTYYTLTTNTTDSDAGTFTEKADEKVTVGENITLTASTKDGYTWLGWYNGNELLTSELNYTFEMPAENITYTAKWTYYTLTVETNNENGGSYTKKNAEKISADSEVVIEAHPYNGYTWCGWYDENGQLQSMNMTISFNMPKQNLHYIAKWIPCPILLEKNLDDAGTVSGVSGVTTLGQTVTITASTNPGYNWLGWYNADDVLISNETSYSFVMTESAQTYTAKWEYATITLNYVVNGEIVYTQEYSLINHIEELYQFDDTSGVFFGWYKNRNFNTNDSVATSTRQLNIQNYNAFLYGGTYDGIAGFALQYVASTDSYKTVGYTGETADVIVPSMFNGYQITSIGAGTFSNNALIQTLYIPANISSIVAPSGCINFRSYEVSEYNTMYSSYYGILYNKDKTSIVNIPTAIRGEIYMPETLISIPSNAFSGRTLIESIYVPEGISSIGRNAFAGCSGLTSLTLPFIIDTIQTSYYGRANNLFGSLFGTTSYAGTTAVKQYYSISEDGGTAVDYYYTYYIPSNLRKVTILGGVIYNGAFKNCKMIEEIVVGDNVTSINVLAFSNCTALIRVDIGEKVKTIGHQAFLDTKMLETIVVNANNNSYSSLDGILYNKGKTSFVAVPTMIKGDITIPSSIYAIPASTFANRTAITGISLPDNIANIGASAFSGCTGLKSIILPTQVVTIDRNAFAGCTGLTSISFPSKLTTIGYGAFSGCTNLSGEISIPSSIKIIYGNAFKGCSKLTKTSYMGTIGGWCMIEFGDQYANPMCYTKNLYISGNQVSSITSLPTSTTEIKDYTFYNCTSLTKVTIPNTVTGIGASAFANCSALSTITIGTGITHIGSNAFSNTAYLLDQSNWEMHPYTQYGYTYNDYVVYIGKYLICGTFSGTTNYTVKSGTTLIADDAFWPSTSLTSVSFPTSLKYIGDGAFCQSNLTTLVIPNSVVSIGHCAFAWNENLKSVTIGTGVKYMDCPFANCDSLTSVTFKTTSGWTVRNSVNAASSISVTNASTNASNLTGSYELWIWERQ